MDSDGTVRNEAEMRPRVLGVGIGESLPVISSLVILLSDITNTNPVPIETEKPLWESPQK